MRSLVAKVARRRMQQHDDGYVPERLSQAQHDFFEALVENDLFEARRAHAVVAQYSKPAPRRSRAEQARWEPRLRAMLKFVMALHQQRLDEKRGIVRVRPDRTPAQVAEGAVVVERFKRWMAGDDSAGPFEVVSRNTGSESRAARRLCRGAAEVVAYRG